MHCYDQLAIPDEHVVIEAEDGLMPRVDWLSLRVILSETGADRDAGVNDFLDEVELFGDDAGHGPLLAALLHRLFQNELVVRIVLICHRQDAL